MAVKLKANGELKDLINAHVKVGNNLKTVLEALVVRDGKWVSVWTNNIIAVNVSHTVRANVDYGSAYWEDKYREVTNVIKVQDLVVKVYNQAGAVIETLVVEERIFSSASYNIGSGMVDLSILAEDQNSLISYTMNINTSTAAYRATLTIGKIFKA